MVNRGPGAEQERGGIVDLVEETPSMDTAEQLSLFHGANGQLSGGTRYGEARGDWAR